MRTYELLFITHPDYDEEQISSIISRYQDVITKGNGTVKTSEKWGKRRLAYEINGLREGLYILVIFDGPPTLAAEVDRVMKIDQDVVRHMITRIDHLTRKTPRGKARRKAKAEETKFEADKGKSSVAVVKGNDAQAVGNPKRTTEERKTKETK